MPTNDDPAELIRALAAALAGARRAAEQLPMEPWLGRLPDAAAAYAVQAEVARLLGWFGDAPATRTCWKSGGPSRAATLTHAALPPSAVRIAPAGGVADLRSLPFHRRGVEAELALRLGRDVSPDEVKQWCAADAAQPDARDLIDAMALSVEIVDSRWQAAPADAERAHVALLNLADQQVHGALALGEWLAPAFPDWSQQRCSVRIGQQPEQHFTGSHPLGDPTWLLTAWLAHLTRNGLSAPAGTVVTTGTWCGLIEAKAGDEVRVHFDGIGALRVAL